MMNSALLATWTEAAGRSIVYGFLTEALGYPGRVGSGATEATGTLDAAEPALSSLLRRAVGLSTESDRAELQRAHGLLFPPVESRDCPTYETAYRGKDIFRQADLMADVAGFYRAHGLRVGGAVRERPDHICTELEFMGFLARKEAYALEHLGPDEVERCREVSVLFLRDHLGCWGPGFGRRVAMVAEHPFYRTVGELLATWLEVDLDRFGVAVVEPADQPLPVPGPAEISCGPGGFAGCGPEGPAP